MLVEPPLPRKWAIWRMLTPLNTASVCTRRPMSIRSREPGDSPIALSDLDELCPLVYRNEMYRWEKGISEFVYNEDLDIFCFPEDGRFAFCDEFADWQLLRERGYLDF
jgi:hypothetical protein